MTSKNHVLFGRANLKSNASAFNTNSRWRSPTRASARFTASRETFAVFRPYDKACFFDSGDNDYALGL